MKRRSDRKRWSRREKRDLLIIMVTGICALVYLWNLDKLMSYTNIVLTMASEWIDKNYLLLDKVCGIGLRATVAAVVILFVKEIVFLFYYEIVGGGAVVAKLMRRFLRFAKHMIKAVKNDRYRSAATRIQRKGKKVHEEI